MDKINLDYDDELATDALQFDIAQGVGAVVADRPASLPALLPKGLHQALLIARVVYGETNSEHSEAFCVWVSDVLAGGSGVVETKAMLQVLHGDKENFGGHLAWAKGKESSKKLAIRARRNASICAMNITRAVLNKFKGLDYAKWIERSLWRATRTEKDMKSEVL